MKKMFAILLVAMTLMITGCSPVETVTSLPVFMAVAPGARNVSIDFEAVDTNETYYLMSGPLLTGWETGVYEIGETYTTDILGIPVETTITSDGDDIVYTGVFPDGQGMYELKLSTNDSFEYEQRYVLESTTATVYVYAKIDGVKLDGSGYFGDGKRLVYLDDGGKNGYRSETRVKSNDNGTWVGLLQLDVGIVDLTGSPDVSFTSGQALEATIDAATTVDENPILVYRDNGVWNSEMDSATAMAIWDAN